MTSSASAVSTLSDAAVAGYSTKKRRSVRRSCSRGRVVLGLLALVTLDALTSESDLALGASRVSKVLFCVPAGNPANALMRHAAFKVHYPLRLIIEVGSPRVNRTCVRQGSGRETETEHSNG
jgi:hypothetical protein